MPWLKSTRRMDGTITIDYRKPFRTAKECMESFGRFELDDSFGEPPCWPVFWPAGDNELKAFEEFLEAAENQKPSPTEELATNLVELVKAVKKHLDTEQQTAQESKG